MEIKLTEYQKELIEQTLIQKQSAEKATEELLGMIFATAKITPPTTKIAYNAGVVSWEDAPLELTPTLEG